MHTRRDFCRLASGAAALAVINPTEVPAAAMASAEEPGARPAAAPVLAPYAQDRPLLELQQAFVDLRFGMFLHFNMATYQDREWGDPRGPAEAFNPTALDTDQWAKAALAAGMKFGCLTTKHHDGFCLWPTQPAKDSILGTSHKTDIVKAYTDSFRKHGLTVGLYYSILDLRGDIRKYNVTREKIERIKTQLTELLTNYGPIAFIIFDGWDAPWSRISYEEVPFHEIYALIKKLQPNCLISELNASEYPPSALFYTDIKAFEQNAGQALPAENDIPAQSCVTLTDGWFWKQSDKDAKLKPAKKIVEEWLIPQNKHHCCLICNAAPNREGKLAPNVVARLEEIGKLWKHGGPTTKLLPSTVITTANLAHARPIHASESPDTSGPDQLNDGSFHNSWYLPSGSTKGWIEVELPAGTTFNTLVFSEPVGKFDDYPKSRIANYRFEVRQGDTWHEVAAGTASKPVRMHALPSQTADAVRLSFTASSDTPHLAEIGVYNEP